MANQPKLDLVGMSGKERLVSTIYVLMRTVKFSFNQNMKIQQQTASRVNEPKRKMKI